MEEILTFFVKTVSFTCVFSSTKSPYKQQKLNWACTRNKTTQNVCADTDSTNEHALKELTTIDNTFIIPMHVKNVQKCTGTLAYGM